MSLCGHGKQLGRRVELLGPVADACFGSVDQDELCLMRNSVQKKVACVWFTPMLDMRRSKPAYMV